MGNGWGESGEWKVLSAFNLYETVLPGSFTLECSSLSEYSPRLSGNGGFRYSPE